MACPSSFLPVMVTSTRSPTAISDISGGSADFGSTPSAKGTEFQLAINTQGRLSTEEQFADVIVKADPVDRSLIRIKDLGRVEMGPNTYALGSLLNNKEAAALAIFQAPSALF